MNTGEVVEKVTASVVTIETDTGTGSGVLLNDTGVIVTNFHVIEDASTASVILSNDDTYSDVSVIDYDELRDIALLKIKAFDIPAAEMGNSNSVSIGDDVIIIGSPRGLQQSVTRGIISAIRDSGDGYRLIQTDAAISPGSSGGGMFDYEGNLVGVVVSKLRDAENINFVIPINYVRGMYSEEPKYSINEISSSNNSTSNNNFTSSADINLGALLNRSPLEFSEYSDGLWVHDFEAEGFSKSVAAYLSGDLLLTLAYVDAEESELTNEDYKFILQENYNTNFAKIGIDTDGDLVSLNELDISRL